MVFWGRKQTEGSVFKFSTLWILTALRNTALTEVGKLRDKRELTGINDLRLQAEVPHIILPGKRHKGIKDIS